MGGGREGEQECRRPAEESRDGDGEEAANPAEAAGYVRAALKLRETFSRESAAEEYGEQQQRDAADLAAEQGLAASALCPARFW